MTQTSVRFFKGLSVLLFVGVVALITWFVLSFLGGNSHLVDIVPAQAVMVSEQVQIDGATPPEAIASLMGGIPLSLSGSIAKTGTIRMPENKTAYGYKMKSAGSAKELITYFGIEGEEFTVETLPHGQLYVPTFSSIFTFGRRGNWVFISEDKEVIRSIVTQRGGVDGNPFYKNVLSDLPNDAPISLSFTTEGLDARMFNQTPLQEYSALLLALRDVIPAGGITLTPSGDVLRAKAKFLTVEGLLPEMLPRRTESGIPSVLQYMPSNAALALTGEDIITASEHTETFLRNQFPDVGVLLSAALEGQKNALLGELNGWQDAWTKALSGGYGIVISPLEDGADTITAAFVLMVQDEMLMDPIMNFLLANAKGTTNPKIISTELPDGTVREEFVIENVKAFRDEPVTAGDGILYPPLVDGGLTLGKKGNVLILSQSQDLAREMLTLTVEEALASNQDVQNAIRYDFSSSQGYGVIQPSSFIGLLEALEVSNPEVKNNWFAPLANGYRRGVFARKFFPGAIYWDMTLYKEA